MLCIFTEHGQKLNMTTDVIVMETHPGTLLRLTCQTSADKFARAALEGNVSLTCGHLTSLVLVNKGVENTPTALLGNHVKTALLKMQAENNEGHVPGEFIRMAGCGVLAKLEIQ